MQIEPRPFGQLLGDSMNSLARTWKSLISSALWAFIPAGFAGFLVFRLSDATEFLDLVFNNPTLLDTLPSDAVLDLAWPFFRAAAATVLIQALAAVFVYVASHRVIATDAAGFTMSGSEARRFALRRYAFALVTGLVALLAIGGLLVAGLIAWLVPLGIVGTPTTTSLFIAFVLSLVLLGPGLWLAVMLSMWSSVVAVERRGIIGSLRRSFQLVRGRWWPTLGYLLVVGLLGSIAIQLIQLVAIPLAFVGQVGFGITIGALLIVVAQGLIVAGIAAMYTTWYLDLRSRKERLLSDELL